MKNKKSSDMDNGSITVVYILNLLKNCIKYFICTYMVFLRADLGRLPARNVSKLQPFSL